MLDAEKFISEVQKYPLLYDHRLMINRRNKTEKFKCWSEIGKAMFKNWNNLTPDVQEERSRLLITKWKAFRDNFVREYKVVKKCERECRPLPKKSKYTYYDRLSFLAPYVYGGADYKPSPDDVDNPPNDVKPLDDAASPFQLLEIIYGQDDEATDKRKSSAVNPEECAADKFTLKCMRIKLPEQWTSDRNATSADGPTRIQEELANERQKMQSVTSRTPVVSNAATISAAHNSNFVYDSVPMQCDERNQDKHGNKAFLLSFVPIMDSLPPHLSLQARMRITEVFNSLVSNIPPEPSGFYTQH